MTIESVCDSYLLEIGEANTIPLGGKYTVFLYTDRPSYALDVRDVAEYLSSILGKRFEIEIEGDFLNKYVPTSSDERNETIMRLASARRWAEKLTGFNWHPLTLEERANYESRNVGDESPNTYVSLPLRDVGPNGGYYEIGMLQNILRNTIPAEKKDDRDIHIIYTSRGLGDTDIGGGIYPHARTAIFGLPNVISSTGMVDGPARPDEFIVEWNAGVSSTGHLENKFKDRMLLNNDSRITEVAKGVSLSAVLNHFTTKIFCESNNCKLFDAHIQEDLIKSQINGQICKKHSEIFEYLSDPNNTGRAELTRLLGNAA